MDHVRTGNLFAVCVPLGGPRVDDTFPLEATEELFVELAGNGGVMGDGGVKIERILSTGQSSPPGFWYDQEAREWVMVLRGRARLEFEDGAFPLGGPRGDNTVLELGPGDWVDIPAHTRHRVAWTSAAEPTLWLAVHF